MSISQKSSNSENKSINSELTDQTSKNIAIPHNITLFETPENNKDDEDQFFDCENLVI